MRKFLVSLLLVVAMTPACARLGAGPSSAGSGAGISATEIAKQADGVATALSNLPTAPDANVQAQIANYAAWGAFLAKAAATIAGGISENSQSGDGGAGLNFSTGIATGLALKMGGL